MNSSVTVATAGSTRSSIPIVIALQEMAVQAGSAKLRSASQSNILSPTLARHIRCVWVDCELSIVILAGSSSRTDAEAALILMSSSSAVSSGTQAAQLEAATRAQNAMRSGVISL